ARVSTSTSTARKATSHRASFCGEHFINVNVDRVCGSRSGVRARMLPVLKLLSDRQVWSRGSGSYFYAALRRSLCRYWLQQLLCLDRRLRPICPQGDCPCPPAPKPYVLLSW